MSIQPLNHHYAMENTASVYDEEAMTALELAGRTTAKVNETVQAFNELEQGTGERLTKQDQAITEMNNETMPAKVTAEVQKNINNGTFDRAISKHAGELSDRVDNLAQAITPGSTSGDAELIDARLAGNGITYPNAGDAIRAQYHDAEQVAKQTPSLFGLEDGYLEDLNRRSLWTQGWVSSTDGTTGDTGVDGPNNIHTVDFVDPKIMRATCDPGYRLRVYRYELNGAFVDRPTKYLMREYAFNHSSYKYRVSMSCVNEEYMPSELVSGPITPADSAHIHFMTNPGKIATNKDLVHYINLDAYKNGYATNYNHPGLWEQGYIWSSTGEPETLLVHSLDYARYIRVSAYIPETVEKIVVIGGYTMRLFRYNSAGDYVDFIKANSVVLDHKSYKYKVDMAKPTATEKGECVNAIFLGNPLAGYADDELGSYIKNADFSHPPVGYYQSGPSGHDRFTGDSTAQEVTQAYDSLMVKHPGYITKKVIGQDCNGGDLYAYDFEPTPIVGTTVPIPKIIIVGGQHGFEKANVFGLYYLLRDMCESWTSSPVLEYLRHHIHLIVVPVLNPTGFNTGEYKNANGVNLNRNYDISWSLVSDTTSSQYGGAEPFDQPETQALKSLVEVNLDAMFLIDHHSQGSGSVADSEDINWIPCPKSDEPSFARTAKACRYHLNNITAHFNLDYDLGLGNAEACGDFRGFTGGDPSNPTLDNWALHKAGIIGLTFEGFNGFPGRDPHTPECHKANAELIGNFLLALCHEYKEV